MLQLCITVLQNFIIQFNSKTRENYCSSVAWYIIQFLTNLLLQHLPNEVARKYAALLITWWAFINATWCHQRQSSLLSQRSKSRDVRTVPSLLPVKANNFSHHFCIFVFITPLPRCLQLYWRGYLEDSRSFNGDPPI